MAGIPGIQRFHPRVIIQFILRGSFWEQLHDKRLRGPLLYTISSFAKVVTMAGSGLVVARLVLPEEIGIWHSVTVLVPYLSLLSLGVTQSAARQFAYLTGAGEHEQAQETADTAFTYTSLWSLSNLVIASIAMLLGWNQKDSKTSIALVLFLITAGSTPFTMFLHNLYRSGTEFGTLGIIQFIEIAYSIISILFVYLFGWVGLFVRYASISLLAAVLQYYLCPFPLHLRFSWPQFRLLFKMGLSRLTVTIVANLFSAADRTLIVTALGVKAMGFYALALLIERAVTVMPLSMTHVIQTRMTMRYGKSRNVASLKRITFFPVFLTATGLIIPTAIAIWLVGPFVECFLPKYSPGINAARLTILSGYFSAMLTSAGIFSALDRMGIYTVFRLSVLALFYLLGWVGVTKFGTIESVAMAKVIAMITMAVGINLLAYITIHEVSSQEVVETN